MAGSSAIKAGEAFIEITAENDAALRVLKRTEAKLTAFGESVSKVGKAMATATALAVAPIAGYAIKQASDAAETLNRFEAVYGKQAKLAHEFAETLAREVGRSKMEIWDGMASFQAFFVGLGFGGTQARAMSQELSQLAIDFASFNNLSDAEAQQRFISALSGSSEVLDKFGINIKQVALQNELLTMGITKSWQEVSEQEKALARLSIIMRAMGDQGAVGDAVKTAGSFANQLKRLNGEIKDAAVSLGNILMPAVAPYVSEIAGAIGTMVEWAQANKDTVLTLFRMTAVVALAGAGMVAFGMAAKGAAMALSITAVTTQAITGITALLGAFVGATAATVIFTYRVAVLTTSIGINVGAFYVWAKAATAAKAVMTAVTAIPIGAVFLAATAAIIGVAYALDRQNRVIAQTSDQMQLLRDRGDDARKLDQLRMERLEQLAQKQRLSNEEQKEAGSLIAALQGKYGDLGLSIDQVTGSIQGATEAQKKLSAAMREAAVTQLKAEMAELQSNIDQMNAEARYRQDSSWQAALDAVGIGNNDAKVKQLGKDVGIAMDRKRAAQLRLRGIEGGDEKAIVGDGPDLREKVETGRQSRSVSAREVEEATKKLASLDEQLAKERRSKLENEVAEIEKLGQEYQKLLQILLDAEKARKEADPAKIADLEQRLAGVDATTQSRKESATAKWQKEVDTERQGMLDDFERSEADLTRKRASDAQDQQIAEMIEQDPQSAQAQLEGLKQQAQSAAQEAKKQYREAMEAAWADSKIDDQEKRTLGQMESLWQDAEAEVDRYAGKLDEAGKTAASKREEMDVAGTFNAVAAWGMGASSATERTAKATEETAKNTQRIATKLDEAGLSFS